MASEDNFLRLDPRNYDTELESLLATSSLSLDDCEALYQNGKLVRKNSNTLKAGLSFISKERIKRRRSL